MDRHVTKNFQAAAGKQGKQFAGECLSALEYAGFEIVKVGYDIPEVGIEIDAQATNRQGVSFFFEFKGSLQGDRPGSKRTDTLKKAICNGYLFSRSAEYECCTPMILMTSHVPIKGAGLGMLRAVERRVIFDVLDPKNHSRRLRWIANAVEEELEADLYSHPNLIDLVVQQWTVKFE